MRNPELAVQIVEAMVKAVTVPVTVKIRKGWDDDHVNAVEYAKQMEAAGVSAIAVHGRTRMQYYSGKADWDIIGRVKAAVSVPVIGNGDIFAPEDGKAMLEQTPAATALCWVGVHWADHGCISRWWIICVQAVMIRSRNWSSAKR